MNTNAMAQDYIKRANRCFKESKDALSLKAAWFSKKIKEFGSCFRLIGGF